MRYYLNLAEHDNVGAQESLFFIYSRDQVGVGLGKKNLSEAIKWGMKAAQNGCVHVQALLANALLEGSFEGEPVEQDREKAILWLRNAAKKGYKKASNVKKRKRKEPEEIELFDYDWLDEND